MSSSEQEQGDSRRRQLDLAEMYAGNAGLQLVTIFDGEPFEDVGLSAFTGEHIATGKLGRFLKALRQERTIRAGDYLLVESLDRVSRQDPMTAFGIFAEIIGAEVTLVTTSDQRIYKNGLDLGGMIQSIVIMSRSNEESERKRDRLSRAWTAKRENIEIRKLTSRRPAWLEVAEWDHSGKLRLPKSFKPIPDRVRIIRRIFEESAAGIGNRTIAERLSRDGLPPFGSARNKTQGRLQPRWQASSVEKILQNRAVLGEFQPYRVIGRKPLRRERVGEPISNYFGAPIIEQSLFERAQAAREQRKTFSEECQRTVGRGGNRGRYISNLFSGVLVCAYCQAKMHYVNRRRTYLVCSNARRCHGVGTLAWRYDHFEASFLAWVRKLDMESILESGEDAEKRKELEERIQAAEGLCVELEQKRQNFIMSIALAPDEEVIGAVNKALKDCLSRLSVVRSEIETKRNELAILVSDTAAFYRSKDEIKALAERLRERRNDQTYKLRAQIAARVRGLVSEIRVAPSGSASDHDIWIKGLIERGELNDLPGNIVVPPQDLLANIKRNERRYFTVVFKDGSVESYTPDDDPYGPVKMWSTSIR